MQQLESVSIKSMANKSDAACHRILKGAQRVSSQFPRLSEWSRSNAGELITRGDQRFLSQFPRLSEMRDHERANYQGSQGCASKPINVQTTKAQVGYEQGTRPSTKRRAYSGLFPSVHESDTGPRIMTRRDMWTWKSSTLMLHAEEQGIKIQIPSTSTASNL